MLVGSIHHWQLPGLVIAGGISALDAERPSGAGAGFGGGEDGEDVFSRWGWHDLWDYPGIFVWDD
jgi:hypothetical protein